MKTSKAASYLLALLLLYPLFVWGEMPGEDLFHAPPSFSTRGKTFVPIDIQYSYLNLVFDVAKAKATGVARIEFYARDAGYPLLDLVPDPTKVTLNGKMLGAQGLALISPPDYPSTKLRYATEPVKPFSNNLLEIEYELSPDDVTFAASGARIGFFMSDVSQDRGFWEQYGPANLEFDHHPLEVTLKVIGTATVHEVFTNGTLKELGTNSWKVNFPFYFSSSSPFLHLSDREMSVKTSTYQGKVAAIPVTVYSDSESLSTQGLTKALAVLKELEGTFGAFTHPSLTAYITTSGGGMEYCGATVTSLSALGHEITHSWFARGVMPVNGNSGWIDEAIASWRDDGYPRSEEPPSTSTSLAGYSPYRRNTHMSAYTQGADFMAHMDYLFSGTSGLKGVLTLLFKDKKLQGITTPELESFFEKSTGKDLSALFQQYILKPSTYSAQDAAYEETVKAHAFRHHPRPFTKEELKQIR